MSALVKKVLTCVGASPIEGLEAVGSIPEGQSKVSVHVIKAVRVCSSLGLSLGWPLSLSLSLLKSDIALVAT